METEGAHLRGVLDQGHQQSIPMTYVECLWIDRNHLAFTGKQANQDAFFFSFEPLLALEMETQ